MGTVPLLADLELVFGDGLYLNKIHLDPALRDDRRFKDEDKRQT